MNQEEWKRFYDIFVQIHSDFSTFYLDYTKGSNRKIRDKAERNVDRLIGHAISHIESNYELYELLTGSGSDYSRAIIFDEFKQCRYFERDLSVFLSKIEEKISSFK